MWLGNQNKEQESVLTLWDFFSFSLLVGVGGGEEGRLICLNIFDAKD